MSRFSALVQHEFRLQVRYGLYFAAAFLTVAWIIILKQVQGAQPLTQAVPMVIFTDLGIIGFYFIAGLVLFEKGERTLQALVVSPIRFVEYLTGKLFTMTVMALVVSFTLTLLTVGGDFNALALVLAVTSMSLVALLLGFISVSPFSSVSAFLMPSQLVFLLMFLPLIQYAGLLDSVLFYLLPTHPSMLMLSAAFGGTLEAWQWGYALAASVIWVAILFWVARMAFNRYILAREGAN